ncbi:MAG: hypothetical protein P4L45_10550, partial [Ignavibacteriaceae bacterium]|nr:hypothetical protein [Ignavibacteriaceae bacterium]
MVKTKTNKEFLSAFDRDKLFKFQGEEFLFVLVGYPDLRAYLISRKHDMRIEVCPEINVITRKIDLTEQTGKVIVQHCDQSKEKLNATEKLIVEPDFEKEKAFFDTIPSKIVETAGRFSNSHWEIIRACGIFGLNFDKLINSNSALAYILVSMKIFNPSFTLYNDLSYMNDLITIKQKEILEKALFPGTERMVKIFKKFDSKILDVEILLLLRSSLGTNRITREEILQILSHSTNINKEMLTLLGNDPALIKLMTSNAVQDLAKSKSFKSDLEKLMEIHNLSAKWNIKVAEIDNLERIDKVKQNLLDKVDKKREEQNKFPPPPIPGNEYIAALKDGLDQSYWAKRQGNCIRGYSSSVKAGRKYFYKVIYGGEEATLEINISGKKIQRGDLLGTRNVVVTKELKGV